MPPDPSEWMSVLKLFLDYGEYFKAGVVVAVLRFSGLTNSFNIVGEQSERGL